MEFYFYVGVIGNIISVLLFLSPIKTFKRIVEQRSTEEFESIPYICTLLNSSLWSYYGIIRPGGYLVATVNGFGILAETIYVVLFLVYAPTARKRAKTAVLVAILDVGFFGAALLVTFLALQGESRIDAAGILAAALNIVMYGSPLAAMVPNGIGFILGLTQLVLYALYKNAKPQTSPHLLEEGGQDEHLIEPSSNNRQNDDEHRTN